MMSFEEDEQSEQFGEPRQPVTAPFLETISYLPRVIQALFRNLSNQDKLQLRVVSQLFCEIVDANCSFVLTVNDEFTDLDGFHELRVRKCIISHLLHSSWKLTNLKFPSLLRKLVITGPITMSNFVCLQEIDLKNLRELVIETDQVQEDENFDHTSRMLKKSTSLGIGIWFLNLRTLKLTGRSPGTAFPMSKKLFRVILQSKFQQLKTFKLRVHCNTEDQSGHLALILPFIARHCWDLRELSVEMTEDPVIDPKEWTGLTTELDPMYLLKLQIDQLKAVQVKRLFLSPVASGIGGTEWATLLYAQRKLEYLECSFQVCPLSLYHYVLNRNWNWLKEVTLHHLTCWETEDHFRPLDLSAFHNCTRLQSLSLSRYLHDSTPSTICSHVPGIINTASLPSSLKKLSLTGFQILCNEVYGISRSLSDLESLSLVGCGDSEHFGINEAGVEELRSHLSKLKMLNVVKIEVSDSKESF